MCGEVNNYIEQDGWDNAAGEGERANAKCASKLQ